MNDEPRKTFEEVGEEKESGLVAEFWHMLKHNKKFWLIPLIAGLLLFGLLIILGGSAAAPFIYTLF
jgi:hypothetical protein